MAVTEQQAPETADEERSSALSGSSTDEQLCRHLVEAGRLREADLARAQRLYDEGGGTTLVGLVTKLGLVSERDVAEAQAGLFDIPLVEAKDFPHVPPANGQLSMRFMKQYHVVPVSETDTELRVAMADPTDRFAIDAVRLAAGKTVSVRVGVPSEIDDAIERFYGGGRSAMGQIVENLSEGEESGADDVEHLRDLASEAPVIRLVNLIMQRAVEARASDIHIEPFENRIKVRYRIDGVLQEAESPPARSAAAVISRVKIMAKLNIAERRLPQDGRVLLRVQGKELDLRVSTIPTVYGESVVMRILDRDSVILDFPKLGFQEDLLQRYLDVLFMPHGIILVTGPTGSGKTTTLYTALQKLNSPERKIITVEDPVEYQIEGVNQIQVKPSIGLTFAGALRSIVRQDPDVIMIGEMRDLETAKIAIQSALTGHLVLSTVHTNDAAGGVTRLQDMGVEDYLLTSTVNGILAQRLVRRLCPDCAETYEAMPEVVEDMGLDAMTDQRPVMLHKPVGCEACNDTGYRGRTSILELLIMSDSIRQQVMRHATSGEIHRTARQEGMRTMYEDGLLKCLQGVTTVEEILRVTQET